MDFHLTKEQLLVRKMYREFAENEVKPLAAEIDEEIKAIIDGCTSRCETILRRNEEKLHAVAAYLLEHETMNAEEFEQVFASQAEPKQTGGEEKA